MRARSVDQCIAAYRVLHPEQADPRPEVRRVARRAMKTLRRCSSDAEREATIALLLEEAFGAVEDAGAELAAKAIAA